MGSNNNDSLPEYKKWRLSINLLSWIIKKL